MLNKLDSPSLQKQFLLPISLGSILLLLFTTSFTFNRDIENLKLGAKVEIGELADVLQLVEALDIDDIKDGIEEVEGYYLQHGTPRLNGYTTMVASNIPNLQFGEFSVAQNADLVETFVVRPKDLITIFVKYNNDFVRIASTVKTKNGARTEFTKLRLDSPAYPQLMAGKVYTGVVSNFGQFHLSKYRPIFDASNKVIGALHFGKQIDLEDMSEAINQWKYLGTGFAAITDQHKEVIFHSNHVSNSQAKQALYGKSKDWVVVSELVPNWQLTIHMIYTKKAAYQKILSGLYPLLFLVSLLGIAVLLIFKNNIRRFVLEPLGGDPATVSALLTQIKQGNLEDDGLKAPNGTIIDNIIKMRAYLKNIRTQEAESAKNLSISASVYDHAQDGIFICDNQFKIISINPAYSKITGYKYNEVINLNLSEVGFDIAVNLFVSDTHTSANSAEFWTRETTIACANDTFIEIQLEIVLVKLEQEEPYYIGLFSDITEAKQHQQQLQYLAFHDPLTDTANRSLLTRLLKERISNNQLGEKIAICYIDLDNFKWINDQYGHHVGDQLLVEVSQRLSRSIRSDDVVARLGGDEFALVLCHSKSAQEYELILSRLLDISKQFIVIDQLEFKTSFSIGYTIYPDDNAEPDILLRHADQAMYQAKAKGGNRFMLFDATTAKSVENQYQLQEEIIKGLRNDEFQLYYQPKISLSTGEIIGFEALIRWAHPTKGMLLPDKFIPAIENTHFIIALGEWVVAESLNQLSMWEANNIHTKVGVNISAHHIVEPLFVSKIKRIFNKHAQVNYNMLDIELTETGLIADIDTVNQTIEECCNLGITFSIDDFGAGYSSINYLRKLSAQTVKIDKDFVAGMNNNPADVNVVKSIISICEDFERLSLAEGVESQEQLKKLTAMGCQFAQGYYIAKPMPAKQVPKWLKANSPFKL